MKQTTQNKQPKLTTQFIACWLLCACLTPLWAQEDRGMLREEIVIPLSDPDAIGTLEVNQIYGGMRVIGYDGKEVIVIAMQEKMNASSEKRNGLRKIVNNSLALAAEESDNHVEVVAKNYHSGKNKVMNLEIRVPRQFNLQLSSINDGDIWVENVQGEMEISNTNDNITLTKVAGSAVVDSVNGLIKADFTAVTADSRMLFTSFNDDIDLTLPANIQADFKLQTAYGDILTGFDVEFNASDPIIEKDTDEDSYRVTLEKWVTGTANGGGTEVVLKSHSGDLILRSK
ncbi:DUF4097 domain-containing protein [Marinicella meishanensis]|uniref:DUF4097 domain-containing protein n=1 Tax=Marinicella meishanensis TaxID=2873263 RepID=UPI001CBE3F64|nr:DUF4097 domain-containing protein [Marinicella sp. NBU2979]